MPKTLKIIAVLLVLITGFFYAADSIAGKALKKDSAAIQSVKPDIVCMVNDEVMNKPQIKVPFEGKIYYGCCPACVSTLKNDRSMRYSKDPVTGIEVDKAKAFILEGENGAALYFQSSETARKYLASKR